MILIKYDDYQQAREDFEQIELADRLAAGVVRSLANHRRICHVERIGVRCFALRDASFLGSAEAAGVQILPLAIRSTWWELHQPCPWDDPCPDLPREDIVRPTLVRLMRTPAGFPC
jgi:hypothetical protein